MNGALRQPSRFTCGAAVAVRAEMLVTGADRTPPGQDGFTKAVLVRHLALTSLPSSLARAQLPWPRTLGTPPWALAADLTRVTGLPHRVVLVQHRAGVWQRLLSTASDSSPVPLYVGSGVAPRHVVLAHGTSRTTAGEQTLTVYEPSRGVDVAVTRHAWVTGPLGLAGWSVPWLAVLPWE